MLKILFAFVKYLILILIWGSYRQIQLIDRLLFYLRIELIKQISSNFFLY